jgi:pimeloyl-ACP methyl ester carboxylesterase
VAGDRDTTIGLESKQLLADQIPGARMARIPESGHATPYDASARFNPLVLGFLGEVERQHANPAS